MSPGGIYHVRDVKPLHGGEPKGRYVVLITDAVDVLLDEPIAAVACTSSAHAEQIAAGEAIPLPWHHTGRVASGLRRPTWAVPRWMLLLRPSQLGRQVGHIPSSKLDQIIAALPEDPGEDDGD